ncbi:hypothetical protein [Steroidobacter cummioxidans]|uniref:hypothetical protein n=1 Tax=Steroidobacter cummioxidans TaxID=1803913 RepID=UPI000E31D30B|nr:hypothetical protein [Steroidobacter cummioxidans]
MDAVHLTHVPLAEVQPGSLLLVGPTDTDLEQYFAIAANGAWAPSAVRLVSLRADRGALRAVRIELSRPQKPERRVLDLGRQFTLEPNLYEQVRTDFRELSELEPGDLLVHGAQHLLVVAPATNMPPLVVDLSGGEVIELSAASVAVITHWNIFVRKGDGQIICLVDTKSHKQASAH